MAKNTIADLDTTAGNNTDVLGQSTAGTANANTLDTIVQNTLGLLARFYTDLGGVVTVGGTANAITLTSTSTYQALETGLLIGFKNTSGPNTGATTVNLDGLGAKSVRKGNDEALAGGEMVDNGFYWLRYDTALEAASGGWALMSSSDAAASTTVSGNVELATLAEVQAGTDTSRVPSVSSMQDGKIVLGTATASTSGASIDFTSIPSWAKQIVISLDQVSTNGTAIGLYFQLGDSGGIETTGYTGSGHLGTSSSTQYTTAFGVQNGSAANVYNGSLSLTLVDASTNTWAALGVFGLSNGAGLVFTGGTKSLSAALDRVRITTSNGTDAFDAGKINIAYL